MRNDISIFGLAKEFSQQVKTFIREEIQLAKTEISEKLASLGKNSVTMAISGFVAYAGLIIFLGALGALLAFVFQRLGLDPLLAAFIGLGVIGLIVIAAGGIMLKGINALKKASLAPEKTIETLQHLKGTPSSGEKMGPETEEKKEQRSSEQIEASVLATESKMAETLGELGERVTLRHMRRQARNEVRNHPYRWGLVAMGTGAATGFIVKRKLSH